MMVVSRRDYLITAVVVVAFMISLLGWVFLPRFYGPERPWGAYLTIVTDLPSAEAERLLHEAGVTDTISEHTTDVSISRFASLVIEPLSSVLVRLDPLDPRLDPYVTGLLRYFRPQGDKGSSVLFAAIGGSLLRAELVVRTVLGPMSRIAERNPWRTSLACALFLGFAGVILSSHRRNVLVLSLGMVPWMPAVIGLGLPGAVAGSLLYFVWVWGTGDLRVTATSRIATTAAVAVLAGIYVALALGPRSVLPMAISIIGAASLTIGVNYIDLRARQTGEHELFRPVSILAGTLRVRVSRSTFLLLPFLLASCLALPVVAERIFEGGFLNSKPGPIATPRPSESVGERDTVWETLNALWMGGPIEGLPDLSDFVAHRAYQEGLMFGRDYRFPSENEEVSISRFSQESDGAYEQFDEVMLFFDHRWLSEQLAAPPRGPAGMLGALEMSTGVVLSPERSLYSGHLYLLQHVMFVFLVLAPFMLGGLQWSVPGVRARVLEIAKARTRRRRQVA